MPEVRDSPPIGVLSAAKTKRPPYFNFVATVLIIWVLAAIVAGSSGDWGPEYLLLPYVASGLLVYFDAKEIGVQNLRLAALKLKESRRWAPWEWAVGATFLWIVFFPWYMAIRRDLAAQVVNSNVAGYFLNRQALKAANAASPGLTWGQTLPGGLRP